LLLSEYGITLLFSAPGKSFVIGTAAFACTIARFIASSLLFS